MKSLRSKPLFILFTVCACWLFMAREAESKGVDSLRTSFFLSTHEAVSLNFGVSVSGHQYALENRRSFGIAAGFDIRMNPNLFVQFGLSYNRAQGDYSAADDSHYAQTGVIMYSALRYYYTSFIPYTGLSFPMSAGTILIRPGFTVGVPLLNMLSKKDRFGGSTSNAIGGGRGLALYGGLSLMAGYQLNHRFTLWGGYCLEFISASKNSESTSPSTPSYKGSMGGAFHCLRFTLCISLKK